MSLARTRILVVTGDITAIPADVIVNSANTRMVLGGTRSVAGAILEATRGRAQTALDRVDRPVPLGNVVVTEGCGLPCRKILHVATHAPRDEEDRLAEEQNLPVEAVRVNGMIRGVSQAIAVARSLGASSMTLPLLGTGHLRMPLQQAAEALVNVLAEDLKEPSTLQTVTIVLKNAADQPVVERAIGDKAVQLNEGWLHQAAALARSPEFARASEVLSATVADRWPALSGSVSTALKLFQGPAPDAAQAELAQLRLATNRLRGENEELRKALEQARAAPSTWNLPMPVALAIDLAESDSNPVRKAGNLRNAAAMLVRYFGALALADYEQSGAQDAEANTWLRDAFRASTGDGRWLQVMIKTARALRANPERSFFKDTPGLWVTGPTDYSPLTGALDRFLSLRNDDIHELSNVTDAKAEQWLERAVPAWRNILERAAPLLRYRLFSLEAYDGFEGDDLNLYLVRWLAGQSLFPRWEKVAWKPRLKRGSVYLIDAAGERFLKLDPFLEYRPCAVTRANETWSLDVVTEDVTFVTFRFSQKDTSKISLPRCLS